VNRKYDIVERYLSTRMGTVLAVPMGPTIVGESPRRLVREASYGYVRVLWWLWLKDGRSLVSVPPGAGGPVQEIVRTVGGPQSLFEADLAEGLKAAVNPVLEAAGVSRVNRVISDVYFVCSRADLRPHEAGRCVRLTDESIPPAPGLKLPTHCFPDGVVFGIVVNRVAASVAYSHRTGVMEDQLADLGVETAEGHRRKGYAKTALAAVVDHFTARGGEALYVCSPDNEASVATARSVGFVPYGRGLILVAPAPSL